MDTLPDRPEQPVALGTAALRADLQARLDALRAAARDWGVRPDHPEGIFIGTMIGTLLISFLRNGCTLLGISTNVQLIVIGIIIVVAVSVDQLARGKSR